MDLRTMALRNHLPTALHEVSRRGYIRIGTATASARCEPGFIMVGASRCGTTSLFRALVEHPQVIRPTVNKGVRYFDLNYDKDRSWYRGHFPLRSVAERRTAHVGRPTVFEASGYYLFHPFAAARIAKDLPDVKIVAMLRDPVERAFSAWKHESARGFEWESFERALELEEERLAGEVDRMSRDVTYESFCHRHHSHRGRGEYVDQLEEFMAHIPRERIHVIQSEAFFEHPAQEFTRLAAFLGLADYLPSAFPQHNARPSSPMPSTARRHLEDHFAPFNDRLERLLGEPLRWS